MQITSQLVFEATQLKLKDDFIFDGVALLATTEGDNLLSFIENKKYIASLNARLNIKGIFCTQEIADTQQVRDDIKLFIVDEPKWYFFSIISYFGKNKIRTSSVIDPSAIIHPTAFISPVGVKIGKNCNIGPNVTILPDVTIMDNVLVRSGVVIGEDGFEHKKTSKGILSVAHDGEVLVENNVEIGANCHIAKGFSYRKTIIGAWTKLDALIHYAHGVQCGEQCLIAAKAMIAGNVSIGNNVWIGPASVISNRIKLYDNSYVTLGSVVVGDVAEGVTVTGNFAVPHMKFLRNFKRTFPND